MCVQYNNLMDMKKYSSKSWSSEEDELLIKLRPQYSSKKWKLISKAFFQFGFQKSEFELRQRWNNHLDPSLSFSQFSEEQLKKLYHFYSVFGAKWSLIKTQIPQKTENSLKNKFYGNIKVYLRVLVNHFRPRSESAAWVHRISPLTLNDLYMAKNDYKGLGCQVQQDIEKMNFKINKAQLSQWISEQAMKYHQIYNKLSSQFRNLKSGRGAISKETAVSLENAEENSSFLRQHENQMQGQEKQQQQKNFHKLVDSPLNSELDFIVYHQQTLGANRPSYSELYNFWLCHQ